MELKVWVEGIQRIVCGVTDNTSCQDVVYALAHATGKTGRFTLIERWRNNERLLAPHEHPLKILTKWGEYSNDVQFILQRSAFDGSKQQSPGGSVQRPNRPGDLLQGFTPAKSPPPLLDQSPPQNLSTPDRNKDIRKSLTFSGGSNQGLSEARRRDNVGMVKGVPQLEVRQEISRGADEERTTSPSQQSREGTVSPFSTPGKREAPPYREPPSPTLPLSPPRCLPPYRDPPPPTNSPQRCTPPRIDNVATSPPSSSIKMKPKRSLIKDFQQLPVSALETDTHQEGVLFNSQYRDLVRLVNYQRQKLTSQQAELTKYDAEIVFWEGKTREQQHQMDFLSQEAARIEVTSRQGEEQLRALGNIEEENEIVRQQEKTLKSEITLLRSKLANCETELLQCKNKIRLLLEDIQVEQRMIHRESEDRQSLERSLLGEVERLQGEVDQAKKDTEMAAQCGQSLQREVGVLESAISDKKRQVERLVSDMKEANLQSLATAPAEEIKHLLEGPHKQPGSTRKMIGSPRQLENAVPTSKNPHVSGLSLSSGLLTAPLVYRAVGWSEEVGASAHVLQLVKEVQ
uniref:Ras-associating domain-containing protein n=1 Tax=Timema cristinae TaxID=61476 RepID=A0A7R9CE53_TIMCR|nr:unnamed protein product [Timema cristinae]